MNQNNEFLDQPKRYLCVCVLNKITERVCYIQKCVRLDKLEDAYLIPTNLANITNVSFDGRIRTCLFIFFKLPYALDTDIRRVLSTFKHTPFSDYIWKITSFDHSRKTFSNIHWHEGVWRNLDSWKKNSFFSVGE